MLTLLIGAAIGTAYAFDTVFTVNRIVRKVRKAQTEKMKKTIMQCKMK